MADYTQQLKEIVEIVRRQPTVPQWVTAIIGAAVGGAIGFVSSFFMGAINRRNDRKTLHEGLCAELDLIFSELSDHVIYLKSEDKNSPSETNFGEFVKADLFQAVLVSPLFWRLNKRQELIKAHRQLKFLINRAPLRTGTAVHSIEMVLESVAQTIATPTTARYLQDRSAAVKPTLAN